MSKMKKLSAALLALLLIAASLQIAKPAYAIGENATPISVNKAYKGVLFNSSYYNYYSFTLTSDGNVNLSIQRDSNSSWYAEILDVNGNTLKSFSTSYGTTVSGYEERQVGLPKGTYFVRISNNYNAYGAAMNFQVKFTAGSNYEKESNGSKESANLINVNTLYQGMMQNNYDTDYYIFTTPSDGNVTLSMLRSKTSSWSVTLQSLDGNTTYKHFSTTYGTTISGWEEKQVGLPKGTYLLKVTNNQYNENTLYQFQVKFTAGSQFEKEANDSLASANLIQVNKAYTGVMQDPYEYDYYAFTLTADGNVTLSMNRNTKSSWYMTLSSLDGGTTYETFHTTNGPTASGLEERQVGLPKGTYIVKIYNYSNTEDVPYNFQVKYTAGSYYEKEVNDTLSSANLMNVNAVYKGSLNNDYERDCYSFSIAKTQQVRVSMPRKQGVSWYMTLYNSDGSSIYQFNTGYGVGVTGNEERSYTLSPGTYYVAVSNYTNAGDIPYELSVWTASPQLASGQVTVTNNKGKADAVTVKGLGTNDVVKVYSTSKGGAPLATVKASSTGNAAITISQIGQKAGTIYVSVTKPGWTESVRTAVTFTGEQSNPLVANQVIIENNKGKPDVMTIKSLGTGDIVNVYNTAGKLIGISMPAENGQAAIAFVQLGTAAGKVNVSITRSGMTESTKIPVSYKAE